MSLKKTVGELVYKISGDSTGFGATIAKTDAQIKDLKKSMDKSTDSTTGLVGGFSAAKLAAAGLATAVGLKLKTAFFNSIKNASDLTESINAVNVVFGEGADKVLEYGKNAANSVGLARSEYNQLATVTGALLKDTGLSADELAEKTNEITVRAADMASVFNTSVPDALGAVNQALRGETEAIRRYAGDVTDASLQTFLFSQGINKNVRELTEQEKRLYRVDLIMKQTEVTAGDFANTSDSLANQQRILGANIKNNSAAIGRAFLPAISNILKAFVKTDGQTKDNSKSMEVFGRTIYRLSNIVIVLGATISNLGAVTKIAWNGLQNAFIGGAGVVLGVMRGVTEAFGADTSTIDKAIADLADQTVTNFNDMGDAVETMKGNSEKIETALGQVFNPTNYQAIEDTSAAVNDLADDGAGGGLAGTGDEAEKAAEKLEGFQEKLLETIDSAKEAQVAIGEDLNEAFKKFGETTLENTEETVKGLAGLVIGAEQSIKDLKKQLKDADDSDERKDIKGKIKEQEEILKARKDFEEREAARITEIRKQLEDAGIDAAKAGVDNLLTVRDLEAEITEQRRIASLDEFARFEEEQVKKREALVTAFITEVELLNNKIDQQKALETETTNFLLTQNLLREGAVENFANAAITKYGEMASSLRSAISLQQRLNSLRGGGGKEQFSKGGYVGSGGGEVHAGEYVVPANMVSKYGSAIAALEAERRGGGGTINNSRTVNAPININAQVADGLDFRTMSKELAWELGRK